MGTSGSAVDELIWSATVLALSTGVGLAEFEGRIEVVKEDIADGEGAEVSDGRQEEACGGCVDPDGREKEVEIVDNDSDLPAAGDPSDVGDGGDGWDVAREL